VPNQIETFTKEFMQDLGLTSLDQALIYTANVENASDFMPVTANGNYVSDPGLGGRVRGIGSGTLTRNFFKVQNPTDNFNLERATVASGPNAILFGLGSPAGILDATPARALMRNRYGFELQYDSENSRRATFDANAVVVPQKLSLRLMGLSKRDYTEKMPNLDRDERLALRASGITVYTMRDIDEQGIPALHKAIQAQFADCTSLHVSFDMDSLDPTIAPGVGTPVSGGLSIREAHLIMELLCDDGRVRALDLVEVNPILDQYNRTAELAVDLTASLFGQRII
jgi:outer membrane receptor protein involved in Fe transport